VLEEFLLVFGNFFLELIDLTPCLDHEGLTFLFGWWGFLYLDHFPGFLQEAVKYFLHDLLV